MFWRVGQSNVVGGAAWSSAVQRQKGKGGEEGKDNSSIVQAGRSLPFLCPPLHIALCRPHRMARRLVRHTDSRKREKLLGSSSHRPPGSPRTELGQLYKCLVLQCHEA